MFWSLGTSIIRFYSFGISDNPKKLFSKRSSHQILYGEIFTKTYLRLLDNIYYFYNFISLGGGETGPKHHIYYQSMLTKIVRHAQMIYTKCRYFTHKTQEPCPLVVKKSDYCFSLLYAYNM